MESFLNRRYVLFFILVALLMIPLVLVFRNQKDQGPPLIPTKVLEHDPDERLILNGHEIEDYFETSPYQKYGITKDGYTDYAKSSLKQFVRPEFYDLIENLSPAPPRLKWLLRPDIELKPYMWNVYLVHGSTLVSILDIHLDGTFSGRVDLGINNLFIPYSGIDIDKNLNVLNEVLHRKFQTKGEIRPEDADLIVFADIVLPYHCYYYIILNPDSPAAVKKAYRKALAKEEILNLSNILEYLIGIPWVGCTGHSINFEGAVNLSDLFSSKKSVIEKYKSDLPLLKQMDEYRKKYLKDLKEKRKKEQEKQGSENESGKRMIHEAAITPKNRITGLQITTLAEKLLTAISSSIISDRGCGWH
jgi:hypothetical protein